MKKWTDLTSLQLLDDGFMAPPTRAWEDLTKASIRPGRREPARTTSSAKPALGKNLGKQQSSAKKVFSSRPTLRQMMSEYNRPTSRTTPIKQAAAATNTADFALEQVDLIQIPCIPGKILRPAR